MTKTRIATDICNRKEVRIWYINSWQLRNGISVIIYYNRGTENSIIIVLLVLLLLLFSARMEQ
jgi:hypothetical protein